MLTKNFEYTALVELPHVLHEGDRIRITKVEKVRDYPLYEYNFVLLSDGKTCRGFRLKVENFW